MTHWKIVDSLMHSLNVADKVLTRAEGRASAIVRLEGMFCSASG